MYNTAAHSAPHRHLDPSGAWPFKHAFNNRKSKLQIAQCQSLRNGAALLLHQLIISETLDACLAPVMHTDDSMHVTFAEEL